LLVEEGWRALTGEIAGRRGLLPPSRRERALAELAEPLLGWLGGAAIVDEAVAGERSPGATAPAERWIPRAVRSLCAEENRALVPCLVEVLRAAAETVAPARRGTLGLDAFAAHCREELAARLAAPPRAEGDWSITPPADCDCALCRTLGAFLADRTERRFEWPLAKAGRQHVHLAIDRHDLAVRHQTRRRGSPYTLVLEKTDALFAHEAAARRAWQADLAWLTGAGLTAAATRLKRRRSPRARPGSFCGS
jgi:hypothetical protein